MTGISATSSHHGSSFRCGLARGLSKLGFCSRSDAFRLILAGRVTVNRHLCHDPEHSVAPEVDVICVDGVPVRRGEKVYLMLNKPRGLVTTARDEKGRATVFQCFQDTPLPFLSPVGRLDQASEGLLLFTNDTQWAADITDPGSHVSKSYHVRINRVPDEALCARLVEGERVDGDRLSVVRASVLRTGETQGWLDLELDEGKNRQIRRLLDYLSIEVLRLVRVSIGPLRLGDLPKGGFRHLTSTEIRSLSPGSEDPPGLRLV